MRRKYLVSPLIALFVFQLLHIPTIQSQGKDSSIYRGDIVLNAGWLTNNIIYWYTLDNKEYSYDITSGEIHEAVVVPQDELAEPYVEEWNIPLAHTGELSMTFSSPDGTFVVFQDDRNVIFREVEYPLQIAIGNAVTGEYVLTGVPTYGPYADPGNLFVLWNSDNTAFYFEGSTGVWPLRFLVSNYGSVLENVEFYFFLTIIVNDRSRIVSDVYEFIDEQTLLVTVTSHRDPNGNFATLIWNIDTDETEIIYEGDVVGAAFDKDNDRILLVTNDGLVEFSYELLEFSLIDVNYDAQWVDKVYFSPDRKHIFIVDHQPEGETPLLSEIFVFTVP